MIEYKAVRNPLYGSKPSRLPNDEVPYFYSPVIDGVEYRHTAETPDISIILGLGLKYEGEITKFHTYALRILGISSGWDTILSPYKKQGRSSGHNFEPVMVTCPEGDGKYFISHGKKVTARQFEHQETALLFALGEKYLGKGSDFAHLGCRMLKFKDKYL